MNILLFLIFLFQAFCCSYCHAVYLLSRDGKHLEFEEWRTTQASILQQAWVDGLSRDSLRLPTGVTSFFVPDSLMQAFALYRLHNVLRMNVEKQLKNTNIDDGYIDFKDIPFKFIHSSCEKDGDQELNKNVTKVFEEKQKQMLKKYFPKRSLDDGFLEIINQTPPEPSSDSDDDSFDIEDWTPPILKDAINFFLNINFILDEYSTFRLQAQHKIESLFFENYKEKIKNGNWVDILNSFYPPINSKDKSPHFINVSYNALTEDGFMKRFLEDRENLIIAITFEHECEYNNKIALLRGRGSRDPREEISEQHGKPDTLASISFGRGYYSGIFRDAHASIAYRSSKHKYFLGFEVPKQIFTDLMFIPPLSWYQNLSYGGELWHPRTTVAISTPLGERNTEQTIEGVNLLPIDKLGILIKAGDSKNHFQNVLKMLESTIILKENGDL